MSPSDGGAFNFGDVWFYGSMGGLHLNAPVVVHRRLIRRGVATGWWPPTGGVSLFGATLLRVGPRGGLHLNAAMTGMACDARRRRVLAGGRRRRRLPVTGDASYLGSVPREGIVDQPPVVGISRTPSGDGATGWWSPGAPSTATATRRSSERLNATQRLVAPVSGIASLRALPDRRAHEVGAAVGVDAGTGDVAVAPKTRWR